MHPPRYKTIVDITDFCNMIYQRLFDFCPNVDGGPDFVRSACREFGAEIFNTLVTHGGNYGYAEQYVYTVFEEELEPHNPTPEIITYLVNECKQYVHHILQQHRIDESLAFYSSKRIGPMQYELEYISVENTPQQSALFDVWGFNQPGGSQ